MSYVIEHVRQLADVIGPRPATTDTEAQAADYVEDVFRARGLDVERQEFDCPRTQSWALVVCHLLTIGAAVLSIWWPVPALPIAVLAAVLLWLELDTRFTIARFLPKGPSQNVIARHVPRVRRGDRMLRVVIVAHYDSPKESLLWGPALSHHLGTVLGLVTWVTIATAALVAVGALPFAAALRPWIAYAAVAASAYLLFPIVVHLHHEFLAPVVDGANDNASGVAVMLGVMEATVPEPEATATWTRQARRGKEAARAADVVVDDAVLEYRPIGQRPPVVAPVPADNGFGDVTWETGVLPVAAPSQVPEPVPPVAPPVPAVSDEPLPTGTDTVAPPPTTGSLWVEAGDDEWEAEGGPRSADVSRQGADEVEAVAGEPGPVADEPAGGGRLKRRRTTSEDDDDSRGIRDWLGIGRGFEVRRAGKQIGSWENLNDDEDEFGFKAGVADGAASEADLAARIRRRVTESIDRALAEKEVWFVATGAAESGAWGMRTLLEAYGEDLKDALIINVDGVGSGTLGFLKQEGLVRRYRCDRRLASQTRRTASELGMRVSGTSYPGVATDATPALARGFRAMSVMSFDVNGRLADWHQASDTIEGVSPAALDQATRFVTALVRDL
jgi:hypothetical protein